MIVPAHGTLRRFSAANAARCVTMPFGTNGALSVSSREPGSLAAADLRGVERERPVQRTDVRIDEGASRD
jgi:hypothetical protein